MKWQAPKTGIWCFRSETKPTSVADIERIATEEGAEAEEIVAIGQIAAQQELAVTPYIVIDALDSGAWGVEVIVPPDNQELLDIYKKYCGDI